MNTLLAGYAEFLAGWIVDFYLLATFLLGFTFVAFRWMRQPVHRLTAAWIVMVELVFLALLCAVPSWPRISLAMAPTTSRPPMPAITGKPLTESHDVASSRTPRAHEGPSEEIVAKSADASSTTVDRSVQRRPDEIATMPSFFMLLGSSSILLSSGFLVGFGIVSLWLCWGAVATMTLCRRASAASPSLKAQLAEIVRNSRLPRLLLSHRVSNAVALGVLQPVILLPAEVTEKNPPQSLDAVLSHEWAHIRNRDLWLLALGRCLFALLFAHPLYWWLRRRIRDDQEMVADAVAAHENRHDYAERLLGWVQLTSGLSPVRVSGAVGLWEVPSQLTRRIAMLLDETIHVQTAASRRWKCGAIGLLTLFGAACSLMSLRPAQSEDKPPQAVSSAVSKAEKMIVGESTELPAELPAGQQMLELPVRVIDADGKPVANAKVTPWALRSSQGHGPWQKDDKRVGVGPKDVISGEDGTAAVLYPYYDDVQEQIRTLAVSLFVDHPQFAYVGGLHIDVPLESKGPYEIKLTRGVPVEIRPLIDGKRTSLDDVFLFWSDGRSWRKRPPLEKTTDGAFRLPAMSPGKNSVLAVKLDGERATHFSKIVDFELTAGEPKTIDVPLQPSLQIHGVLSDNVPRPVRQGRIKIWTLPPAASDYRRVEWFSWAAIQPDGTFTIDGWPADERMQLIALCDGYFATSGRAPDVVEHPRDPDKDPFCRPQVFDPGKDTNITVAMSPLVRCVATAVDEDDKPVAGVTVESWPNVGWWNAGSQLYCHPLVHGERLLREREYFKAIDESFPAPFQGTTDAQGKATLELPPGNEDLVVESNVYELPVFLGRRDVRVKLVPGQTTEATLRLQPAGSEKLGEWDKLAGVVFGCSTREGRRICALPSVQEKMHKFEEQFREAKNQRDPKLLSEAYTAVADAFTGVGDPAEAAKWRKKAAEQAEKAKAEKESKAKTQ
jgi:beta-lactamase regulating signal transducer with metallopeptidase domain